ncbi:hypothetical protein H0H87_012399 [Tephrocybe sp. NHM501043]|nr:hypothetical protein H0H87_012399 [Tephrocybe sp. NHM501043]
MDTFRVPQTIPQDLLLIHDLIGVVPPVSVIPAKSQTTVQPDDDCIDSSDSENGSEDEIEADLTAINDEDDLTKTPASDSSSESDSDSESEESEVGAKAPAALDLDDDEDNEPAPTSGAYFQTKNEVVDADIVVPDITEVGPEEVLEKVGEIMTVMGNTVIVNGVPSDDVNRGSDRALDSDTLLVFGDRKVMGYIFETFGPTSRPLYQVKFNKDFPPDAERVQISRDVFHVPSRSNFVFLSALKKLKGSDASNVHDEEPAENELEFSDDEAEEAYRASIKRKRAESRAPSVAASSRQSTPTPSQMYDQDMEEARQFSRNPYDEHGPYDLDFSAGPSQEEEEVKDAIEEGVEEGEEEGITAILLVHTLDQTSHGVVTTQVTVPGQLLAIARATGQLPDGSYAPQNANYSSQSLNSMGGWGYPDAFQSNPMFQFGATGYPLVQPHINPRFANAFGMNMSMAAPSSQYSTSSIVAASPRDWADEWAIPSGQGAPSGNPTNKSTN